jgi:uncharacterized membrane protein YcjF (UPF0283 family)
LRNEIKNKDVSTEDELTITGLEFDDKETIQATTTKTLDDELEKNITEASTFIDSLTKSFASEEISNSGLKKTFSKFILGILALLSIVISAVIILQGFKLYNFNLEEWTLRLFVTSVFIEIIALIKIMINSLFPKDDRKVYLDFVKECAIGDNKGSNKNRT